MKSNLELIATYIPLMFSALLGCYLIGNFLFNNAYFDKIEKVRGLNIRGQM